MKSLMMIALLTAPMSCSPPPPPPKPVYPLCDYCRAPKKDAKIYPCRQCGKSHSSCSAESPLHVLDVRKDKEGLAAGRSVKLCPEGDPK
jgi:hypothetical protein